MSIDLIAQIVCYCSALSGAGGALCNGTVFCLKSLGFWWKWSTHVRECALKSHFALFNSGECLQEPFVRRDSAEVAALRPCPYVGGYSLSALWAFCPQANWFSGHSKQKCSLKGKIFRKNPLYWCVYKGNQSFLGMLNDIFSVRRCLCDLIS